MEKRLYLVTFPDGETEYWNLTPEECAEELKRLYYVLGAVVKIEKIHGVC